MTNTDILLTFVIVIAQVEGWLITATVRQSNWRDVWALRVALGGAQGLIVGSAGAACVWCVLWLMNA